MVVSVECFQLAYCTISQCLVDGVITNWFTYFYEIGLLLQKISLVPHNVVLFLNLSKFLDVGVDFYRYRNIFRC